MEKPKKLMTLVIVYDHPRILLGMKKVGLGKGRWNGFGGKVEVGESIEAAAKREVLEEAGINVGSLNKVGVIEFEFQTAPALFSAIAENRAGIHNYDDEFSRRNVNDNLNEILEVHIFKTDNFRGEPKETEEMAPRWFFVDEIPFLEMWPDDRYWFPYLLRGKKIIGKFVFGDNDVVLDYFLQEVENL